MTHTERIRDAIIKQTDYAMPRAIQLYGCRFMALIAIPQFVVGEALTVEQILDIAAIGKSIPTVIKNANFQMGRDEHEVINLAFQTLGVKREGRQVGWDEDHIKTVQWEYMIREWSTDTHWRHFDLADRRGQELYDPYDRNTADYSLRKNEITRKLLYRTWET
jgi:hypothetical protein